MRAVFPRKKEERRLVEVELQVVPRHPHVNVLETRRDMPSVPRYSEEGKERQSQVAPA